MVEALIWANSLMPPANGTPTHLQPRSSLAISGAIMRALPNHGARAVVFISGSRSNSVVMRSISAWGWCELWHLFNRDNAAGRLALGRDALNHCERCHLRIVQPSDAIQAIGDRLSNV